MPSELKTRHNDHEDYEKLIVLYSTGELTHAEVELLAGHLRNCESCREDLSECRTVFRKLGPTAFFNQENVEPSASESSWAPQAKKQLLKSFEAARERRSNAPSVAPNEKSRHFAYSEPVFSPFWKGVSSALLLVLLVGGALITKQNVVSKKPRNPRAVGIPVGQGTDPSSSATLGEIAAERDNLKLQLTDRSAAADSLARRINEQQAEIVELKTRMDQLASERDKAVAGRDEMQVDNTSLKRDQQNVAHRLQDLESSLSQTQQQLHDLQSQHAADLVESIHLQNQVAGLNAELRDRDATIKQQQELLASDRDIRDLMGARELTIAEISDFDLNAQKKKPFGRVFFTKNKSLIFYAFDLDKQRGLHNASAFQAWGVSDSDRKTAVNLGILYKDSEANRRWTLKFDDPEILEKIDAVFVTVEPNGGSVKPSGKQLLYAYIRTQPNHP